MERDQAGNVRRNAVLHFNSHAHVERDFAALVASSNVSKFQLTRSRGAWLYFIALAL